MKVEGKSRKQLEKMLDTRFKRLEDYEKKINQRSKYRGASAGSMNKAVGRLVFSKKQILEEIQAIQDKLNSRIKFRGTYEEVSNKFKEIVEKDPLKGKKVYAIYKSRIDGSYFIRFYYFNEWDKFKAQTADFFI